MKGIMGQIDELLYLGDRIYEYRFSNEVVAFLKERCAHVIQGNHEKVFMGPQGTRARGQDAIGRALLQWLADRPARSVLEFGGKKGLMVHSTPREPRRTYVYTHGPQIAHSA